MGRAVDFVMGAPGEHIAMNAVAALAAVALADGDVLNAAAALKDFQAIKGRGARLPAMGADVIDESYNANPASMAAALALLSHGRGRKIAILGDMLEMGQGAAAYHAALAEPIAAAKRIGFAAGQRDEIPVGRVAQIAAWLLCRKFRGTGAARAGRDQTRRYGAGEGIAGQQDGRDRGCAEREGGLMLYYLSLSPIPTSWPSSGCSAISPSVRAPR